MHVDWQVIQYEHGSQKYYQAIELRRTLLRLPLGLDFTEQDIAEEANQHFFGVFQEDQCIATLTLEPDSGRLHMRQVAVAEEFQGMGLGRTLVVASEAHAKLMKVPLMYLHARVSAVPFYTRLGYQVSRPEFYEVSIPHRYMSKNLLEPHETGLCL